MKYTKLFGLFVILTSALSASAQEKIVKCTATQGYHCTPKSGCVQDATYVTEYRVDLDEGTVTELTVQHTKRDPNPLPGATTYTIMRSVSEATPLSERSITAVGKPGTSAVETILIGEKSYLSSSVSSAGTRIFSMMGTCKGF